MKVEINIYIVLLILFIHWFTDVVSQTDKQAKGKSKNRKDLLRHSFKYSIIWLIPIFLLYPGYTITRECIFNSIWFVIITFICYTVIDYFTSKLSSELYKQGKIHWYFASIGIDQFLHFTHLLITYKLLIK